MKLFKYGLNIQLFAADDGGTPSGGGNDNPPTDEGKFTQADIDRAVSKGIATREAALIVENQKAIDDAVAASVAEQKRLDALSDADRLQEAQRLAVAQLEQREADLNQRALVIDVRALLVEEDLPVDSLDIVMGQDLETTKENIKVFKELVGKQVQIEVDKIIKKPGVPGSQSGGTLSKDDIMNIKDPQERQKAIADNIELFG